MMESGRRIALQPGASGESILAFRTFQVTNSTFPAAGDVLALSARGQPAPTRHTTNQN